MSLEVDSIIYRRRLRRRLLLWQAIGLAALALLVIVGFGKSSGLLGDRVARLAVESIIVDDPDRDEAIADLLADDHVKAVILRINSPGGTVAGSEALFLGLRRLAEKKPVVAVMGELATSGGYMAAIAADRIFAREGSLTGSIGVLMQTTEITGLLDKIGIKPEAIKSHPLKAQPNPLEPLSPEARQAVTEVVMDMHALFTSMVAERRALTPEKARILADGRVFTGRQALEKGLIDAIGGEDEALAWLEKEKGLRPHLPVKEVKIRHDEGVWRDLLGLALGKTLFSERLRLDGLVSVWHPDLR